MGAMQGFSHFGSRYSLLLRCSTALLACWNIVGGAVHDSCSRLIGNLHAQRMPTRQSSIFSSTGAGIKPNCIFGANSLCNLSERIRHRIGLSQKKELSTNAPDQLSEIKRICRNT